jgi:hypothetical protein
LDNIDVDVMKEDCVGIDYSLWSKEWHSTSNPTTIASTLTKTSTEEFLEKGEESEKYSTINPMVNDSSNPNKLVMSANFVIDNSYLETYFGRENVELSTFANSYKQSELLPCNQIDELDCTLVDNSFTYSCTLFTNSKSWTLYFYISMNEYGADVRFLITDSCGNQTYLVVELEPRFTDTIVEYETLIQGLRKAINMNVKYIKVFGGS